MENFIISDIDFEDERLQILCTELRKCFVNKQTCFAKICETIYYIWSYCRNNYLKAKDNEYYNSYKLLAKFGFDKKSVSRYKQCYEKFIHKPSCTVESLYLEYSASKLFELLPLSMLTIEDIVKQKIITAEMTVKQIREVVKNLTANGEKLDKVTEDLSTEINEDEIPMAYDPTKKYEYSYFENMNKSQLLNIVWELQKAYQKLKSKGEKNEK
jgi:ferritin-like protein